MEACTTVKSKSRVESKSIMYQTFLGRSRMYVKQREKERKELPFTQTLVFTAKVVRKYRITRRKSICEAKLV